MFTSEASQKQKLDRISKENLAKEIDDAPLFENPRESIKNFTDSLAS